MLWIPLSVLCADPDNPDRDHNGAPIANAIDPPAAWSSPVTISPSPLEEASSPTTTTQSDEKLAVNARLAANDVPGSSESGSPSLEKECHENFGETHFLDAEQQSFAYINRRHPGTPRSVRKRRFLIPIDC